MIQKTFPSNLDNTTPEGPILEHGLDLFSQNGVKGFTVESLAKDLAMSKKTIYKFFPTKEILLQSILQHMTGILHGHFIRVLAQNVNPLDKFIRVMDKVATSISRVPISRLSELKARFPAIWEELEAFRMARRDDFFAILKEGESQGLIRSNLDLEKVATLFMNIINQVFQPEFFLQNQLVPKDIIKLFRDIFLRGIVTEKGLKHIEEKI